MQELLSAFTEINNLSKRETEVFNHLVLGVGSRAEDISKMLGIRPNTVRIHLKNINTKLRVRGKTEALQKFLRFSLGNF